jgi:uridylate kinase
VCDKFSAHAVDKSMRAGEVGIFAGGTGNPFFTTDTAACLRGIEIGADVVVKATKVDGVYDKDPIKFTEAKKYDTLSYDEVLEQKLGVMDLTAIVLCQNHNMPLRVIDMTVAGNLQNMLRSDKIGTLVSG